MGTATKITAVDEQSTVQGVSIMPGVFISLDALVNGTSLLKGIATNAPVRAIGKNTVESMQSGVVFGAASMLDGMVERFEAELGPAKTLVATGGAAGIVVPHCRHSVQYVPTAHSGRPLCRVHTRTHDPLQQGVKSTGAPSPFCASPCMPTKQKSPTLRAAEGLSGVFIPGDTFILRPCRRSSLRSLRRRRRPR